MRPMPRTMRWSCQRWAMAVLAVVLIPAVGAGAQSATLPYVVIRLANSPSYGAAHGQVNKQLTVLQSKRTGSTEACQVSERGRDQVAGGRDRELAGRVIRKAEERRLGGRAEKRTGRSNQVATLRETSSADVILGPHLVRRSLVKGRVLEALPLCIRGEIRH